MLLHVARDRAGRRRLIEIAVLSQEPDGRAGPDGRVRALTVWQADRGPTEHAAVLQALLRRRGDR